VLAPVVDFVADYGLDEVLDVEVAQFVDPLSVWMLPDGIGVHQVEPCLVSRHASRPPSDAVVMTAASPRSARRR